MAHSTKALKAPEVKSCEACGCVIERPAYASDGQWKRKRACSRSCASKIGNKIKWAGAPTMEERFWKSVDKTPGQGPNGDCWEWQAGRLESGYGRITIGKHGEEKAHRLSYRLNCEEIPDGLWVLHDCDNPPCCNPDHLFLGTSDDNVADMVAKRRHRFGVRHHKAKLSDDEVRAIRSDPRMQIDIADEYGVTQGLIGMIKRGEIWTHVR